MLLQFPLIIPGVQSSAAGTTGVSLTNHFDRFVATRQQAVTGVTASVGKDASSLPAVPASQQSAVAALPAVPASQRSAVATLSAVPASQQSAVATQQSAVATLSAVPASQQSAVAIQQSAVATLSAHSEQSVCSYLLAMTTIVMRTVSYHTYQTQGTRLEVMNPSSEDDISDDSGADGDVVDEANDGSRHPDDKLQDDVDTTPQNPNDPIQLTLGPADAMVSSELSCDITAHTVLLYVLFCLTHMYRTYMFSLFPMLRLHLQH